MEEKKENNGILIWKAHNDWFFIPQLPIALKINVIAIPPFSPHFGQLHINMTPLQLFITMLNKVQGERSVSEELHGGLLSSLGLHSPVCWSVSVA